MNDPGISIPVRAPAQHSLDDTILPFEVKALEFGIPRAKDILILLPARRLTVWDIAIR